MMGAVQKLAATVKEGLQAAPPKRRTTIINKLALAVGALPEAQTPHTSELANVLPVPTERQDPREQWLRWRLTTPLLQSPMILEPFARTVLEEAARPDQTVILRLEQTDLGDRCAIVMLAVQLGDRSLPVAWQGEAGAAHSGFAGQQVLLDGSGRGCQRRPPCYCWETGSIPPPGCLPGGRGTVGRTAFG